MYYIYDATAEVRTLNYPTTTSYSSPVTTYGSVVTAQKFKATWYKVKNI